MIQPNEVNGFKKIPGYEKLYEINEYGEIFSFHTNKLLKPNLKPNGYFYVVLSKDCYKKNYSIHRLVAITFLENKLDKPCVNHIDGNKTNNHVSNLEWCTYSENEKHSYHVLGKKLIFSSDTRRKMADKARIRKANFYNLQKAYAKTRGVPLKIDHKKKISDSLIGKGEVCIMQFSLSGMLIRIHKSVSKAAIETNIKQSGISNCLTGLSKSAGGFKWVYYQANELEINL